MPGFDFINEAKRLPVKEAGPLFVSQMPPSFTFFLSAFSRLLLCCHMMLDMVLPVPMASHMSWDSCLGHRAASWLAVTSPPRLHQDSSYRSLNRGTL